MSTKKSDLKILYLSFHNSLKKRYGINTIICKKEIFTKLGRQFLVPKGLRVIALKELEVLGLIKKEDKSNYKILKGDNIEDKTNEFYKNANLF